MGHHTRCQLIDERQSHRWEKHLVTKEEAPAPGKLRFTYRNTCKMQKRSREAAAWLISKKVVDMKKQMGKV